MHEVTIFQYHSHPVRSLLIDGEPWFVAKDVCDVLGLSNITEALRGLDQEDLTSGLLKSGGQHREVKLVSEPGLYNLIFKSRTAAAREFKRWVAREVLPSIRKTGSYHLPDVSSNPPLTTDLLRDVAYASRNAAMTVKAQGHWYNQPLARRLVNDMVIETTGYDLMARFRETGLLPDETNSVLSYRQVVMDFVADCCELDENGRESAADLYAAYCRWQAQWGNARPMSRLRFGRCLSGEFSRIKASVIFYVGLRLRNNIPATVEVA